MQIYIYYIYIYTQKQYEKIYLKKTTLKNKKSAIDMNNFIQKI